MEDVTRAAAISALAAASAAAAAGLPRAGAAAPLAPELSALLATLQPVGGVIAADRVRAAGIAKSELMNQLIPWAKTFADPPISHFFVGAVMEGASGALYAGMNLEYPGETLAFTIHGEGAATANAWMHDETGIVSLAVGGVPCGYCRQYLSEFVQPEELTIWLPAGGSISLAEAMPRAFLPSVLGITIDPFHARASLALATPSADPLVRAALGAAMRSHAPYSKTLAGVALRLSDGSVITGRHAENVAFNPAMPALQCAGYPSSATTNSHPDRVPRCFSACDAAMRTCRSAVPPCRTAWILGQRQPT